MDAKRLIGVLILCAALAGNATAFAQGGPPGGGRGGPPPLPDADQIEVMVDELDEAIDLTDPQEAEVLELYIAHFEDLKKAVEAKQDRSKMQSLRTQLENDVKALLDDEQTKAYEEYLETQGPGSKRPKRRGS